MRTIKEPIYVCQFCGKIFISRINCENHEVKHFKGFKCKCLKGYRCKHLEIVEIDDEDDINGYSLTLSFFCKSRKIFLHFPDIENRKSISLANQRPFLERMPKNCNEFKEN